MDIFYGVVINNNDPAKMGRVQIKVHGEHDQTSDNETLPWADVMQSASNGLIGGVGFSNVLKNGTWVYVVKIGSIDTRYLVLGVCTGIVGEDGGDGFSDPTGQYPIDGTNGLSDFGHCSITDTSLKNRAASDTSSTSKGVSFQYENTVSPNKYLNSSIYRSASGIMVEVDDGEEKLKITHPSGSVVQMNSDGTVVLTTLGNFVLNCKGNTTFNIRGNYNLNVDGDYACDIKGNSRVGIQGKHQQSIDGTQAYQVQGNSTFIGNSNVSWTVHSNVTFEVADDVNITSNEGTIKGPNVITHNKVDLDKHVHDGVDRGRSSTDRAEDSV